MISKILRAKFIYKNPTSHKILIYDKLSEKFAKVLFPKNSYHIFDARYESLNIPIFFKTLLENGFKDLSENYKKNYIKKINPKIVYTSIDNSLGFYKLKKLFNNPIYISDQNGMRDNTFVDNCKNYLKVKKNINLKCDYLFTFGLNEKKRLSNLIEGRKLPLGNTLNNYYLNQSRKIKNKILFISSGINNKKIFNKDAIIFKHLINLCNNKSYQLSFLSRPNNQAEKVLKNKFPSKNWNLLVGKNRGEIYKLLSKFEIIIFAHSTLGYEALARGYKCISFNNHFFPHHKFLYKRSGPFWSQDISFNVIKKILLKVKNYKEKEWLLISKKYSKELMSYDKSNIKKLKIIKKILKKTY